MNCSICDSPVEEPLVVEVGREYGCTETEYEVRVCLDCQATLTRAFVLRLVEENRQRLAALRFLEQLKSAAVERIKQMREGRDGS